MRPTSPLPAPVDALTDRQRQCLTLASEGLTSSRIAAALGLSPRTVDDIVTHSVSRALDLFGLDTKAFPRWTGPSGVAGRRQGK